MSVYNKEHNLIFIHIPRTAGTSMEQKGFIGGGGHHNIYHYKKDLSSQDFEKAFKFAFIRNPFARAVSAFFYIDRGLGIKDAQKEFVKYLKEGVTQVNIKTWIGSFKRQALVPQWYFICDEDGNIELDFIGRFENLENDWMKVCETLKTDNTELSYIRKSNYGKHQYQDYYTSESINLVKKMYKQDFELLSYKRKL